MTRHQFLKIIGITTLFLASTNLRAQTPNAPTAPTRIVCIGDSITAGKGLKDREINCYPAQLQRMLGKDSVVQNYGKSGTTLINSLDRPYQKTGVFGMAIEFKPDVAVIQLGTNDAIPANWVHKDKFVADYLDLIGKFRAIKPEIRIFLSLPPWIGNAAQEAALQEQLPLIKKVAAEAHVDIIDVHGAFLNQPNLLGDGLHPNTEGATLIAKMVYAAIMGKPFTGEIPGPSPESQGAATQGK